MTPIEALTGRILPLVGDIGFETLLAMLNDNREALHNIAADIMQAAPEEDRFVLVIDQFEEVFTRVSVEEQSNFLDLLHYAVTSPNGRVLVLITMRADFFD